MCGVPIGLRHTFASLLSDDGMAIEKISRLVGHTSSHVTETVYRQQLRPVPQEGAQTMDKIFGRQTGPARRCPLWIPTRPPADQLTGPTASAPVMPSLFTHPSIEQPALVGVVTDGACCRPGQHHGPSGLVAGHYAAGQPGHSPAVPFGSCVSPVPGKR